MCEPDGKRGSRARERAVTAKGWAPVPLTSALELQIVLYINVQHRGTAEQTVISCSDSIVTTKVSTPRVRARYRPLERVPTCSISGHDDRRENYRSISE